MGEETGKWRERGKGGRTLGRGGGEEGRGVKRDRRGGGRERGRDRGEEGGRVEEDLLNTHCCLSFLINN